MNRLHRRFIALARRKKGDIIEFGNLRKGQQWGVRENNHLTFMYEVDVIAERPFFYHIVYDFDRKLFLCYSRLGAKLDNSNMLQFTAGRFKVLDTKLSILVEHIPAVRERVIRQYFFSLAQQKRGRRWLRFFRKERGVADNLKSLLKNMLDEKKISQNEFNRISLYVQDLCS